MYLLARYYFHGFNTVSIDIEERNNWCKKAIKYNEPLSTFGYAEWCLKNNQFESNKAFEKLFKRIKNMAEDGDVLAQGILGYMYSNGRGTEQNDEEADRWFSVAAKNNDSVSQYNIGGNYFVKKEYSKAEYWFKIAADKGYASAQSILGCMYYEGEGITANKNLAIEWYKKAAAQDDEDAQENLKELGIYTW